MTDMGRAVLPDMSPGGFTIDEEILLALQQDPIVWQNFQNFPPLYRRVRIDTIQIKKKQRPLFESRLKKFIDNTRHQKTSYLALMSNQSQAPLEHEPPSTRT